MTHATHAVRELRLAMRSLDSVFEDTLGKHVSPSKKSVEPLFTLTSFPVAGAG